MSSHREYIPAHAPSSALGVTAGQDRPRDSRGRGNSRVTTLQFPESFEFDDGIVVVRRDTQGLFLLNSTAAALWECLRAGLSVQEIALGFSESCNVPYDTAVMNVTDTIRQWQGSCLMTASEHGRHLTQPEAEPPSYQPVSRNVYEFAGQRVQITLWDDSLASEMECRLAQFQCDDLDCWHESLDAWTEGDVGWLRRNGTCVSKEHSLALRVNLLTEIARFWNPGAEWLVTMHAGAVTRDSGCVLLPGASGAGKSTLVAALVHRDFELVTEDLALIDFRRLNVAILPYAIKLRAGSWNIARTFCRELDTFPIH
jgi:hypothetical protein